jgi:hypothetical protein
MLMSQVFKQSEDELQANIVDYLRLKCRLTVLQTNLAKRHPVCDKGVPDLIVTSDAWPRGCWLGLEIKTDAGKLSPEQKDLEARDRIVVVRSMEEAEAACRAFCSWLAEGM